MSEQIIRRLFERACRHAARGRPHTAVAVYAQVLAATRDPGHLESAHWGSGELLAGLGRHRDAIEHLRAAIALNPTRAAYLRLLGESLRAVDDASGAAEAFAGAVHLAPRDAESHRLLGWALLEAGERARARHELAQAVFLDRANLQARIDLAVLLGGDGRFEAALDLVRSVRRADPGSASVRQTLEVLEVARRARAGSAFSRAIPVT